MFDLSFVKIAVLAVLALVIFGPEQLPKIATQAGRMLRELRGLADRARADLQENLGPEFGDFDIADLNPRVFVRKHLFDEGITGTSVTAAADQPSLPSPAGTLLVGESPPYDAEAT